jgi:hypothetical protein
MTTIDHELSLEPVGLFTAIEFTALELLAECTFPMLSTLGITHDTETHHELLCRAGVSVLKARGLISIEQTQLTRSPVARLLTAALGSHRTLSVAAEHADRISFLALAEADGQCVVFEPNGDDIMTVNISSNSSVAETTVLLIDSLRSSQPVSRVVVNSGSDFGRTMLISATGALSASHDGVTQDLAPAELLEALQALLTGSK